MDYYEHAPPTPPSPRHSLGARQSLQSFASLPHASNAAQQGGPAAYYHASGAPTGDFEYDSEDWAVYNSFNQPGHVPASSTQPYAEQINRMSLGGLSQDDTALHISDGGGPMTATPRAYKPKWTSHRRSLLGTQHFGFDPRTSDPRLSQYSYTPATLASGWDKPLAALDLRSDVASLTHKRSGSRPEEQLENESQLGKQVSASVELITVPGLGAEYSSDELKHMRRTHRRRVRATKRKKKLAFLARGEGRWLGCLDNRSFLFVVFGFLILLGLLLYFVIPRPPSFALLATKPLDAVPDGSAMKTNHIPTNFSMDMLVNMRADNTGGWVPTKASKMTMEVLDLTTQKIVGEGFMKGYTFPGREIRVFQFPVSFAYASVNASGDATWSHYINACGPKYEGTPRQSLNLRFSLTMSIEGLIGKRGTAVQLSNIECPFTLQAEYVDGDSGAKTMSGG